MGPPPTSVPVVGNKPEEKKNEEVKSAQIQPPNNFPSAL
jgi:hypothetical protein